MLYQRLAHAAVVTLFLCTAAAADDFALRDGDTVVFLGDSITAARTYSKIIENYTLLRFPRRRIRFINAGWGGDTAAGGLARLERDVFAHGATVLTVAYGVNDIGWGVHADEAHKQKYLDAIRGIVERCRERQVRVYICSAAITSADPDKAERDFLQTMCDEGLALAREQGAGTIDLQRSLRAVQRRVLQLNAAAKPPAKPASLHAADGVHLNDLGQLAMAVGILEGLGAPADVSQATVDRAAPQAVAAVGCTVSDVQAAADGVEFTRLDEGLPITFGLFGALQYAYVPVHERLARYMLTVRSLPPGRYEVVVDGRSLGGYSAAQLGQGVNLSFATANAWQPGGPWDVQATLLKHLTEARHELALSELFRRVYEEPDREQTAAAAAALNDQLEALQRATARPRPYRFVVRPAAEPAQAAQPSGAAPEKK